MKPEEKLDLYANLVDEVIFDLSDGINYEEWESLVINRRKPHTYRAFKQYGDFRVCFHYFEPCHMSDAFTHPHGWPAFVYISDGDYIHRTWYGKPKEDDSNLVCQEALTDGSFYFIDNPETFHQVVPIAPTWTMMINGKPYDNPNEEVRTTKGKDLEKMDDFAKSIFLEMSVDKLIRSTQ